MTPDNFRNIALSMPGTVEASHKGHPDFRVGGTVFATIGWPDNRWAMVKLTPEQQATFLATSAKTFAPVPGGWGRRGCTNVRLAAANPKTVKNAVETAWENIVAKAGTAKRAGKGSGTRLRKRSRRRAMSARTPALMPREGRPQTSIAPSPACAP